MPFLQETLYGRRYVKERAEVDKVDRAGRMILQLQIHLRVHLQIYLVRATEYKIELIGRLGVWLR